MPFKFNDLMVTVLPRMRHHSPECAATSGGCEGTTTGALCSSEGCEGMPVQCGDSGEMIELAPYSFIDPAFQLELRQLLLFGLQQSRVGVPSPIAAKTLEAQMRPRTLRDIDKLEGRMKRALKQLQAEKAKLKKAPKRRRSA
jgi:hypothetical protein